LAGRLAVNHVIPCDLAKKLGHPEAKLPAGTPLLRRQTG